MLYTYSQTKKIKKISAHELFLYSSLETTDLLLCLLIMAIIVHPRGISLGFTEYIFITVIFYFCNVLSYNDPCTGLMFCQ